MIQPSKRSRAIFASYLAAALVFSTGGVPAHSRDATAALMERELKAAGVLGASYAIVDGDRVTTGAYGLGDAERGVPMTADTLLQIGSLTKLLTALAVVSALEAEGLPLRTAVGRHLADVHPRLAESTYHELLAHTAGLRDRPGAGGSTDERELAGAVRRIGRDDFLLPRGTVFSYSNLGYAAAGAALERIRGKPFADALSETVIQPLQMRTASMRAADAPPARRAVGHRLVDAAPRAVNEADVDTSLWPAGYLWASARDMARVVDALVNPSRAPDALRRALSVAASPHAAMPNVLPGGHYGYGLMLATDRGARIYEHGGTQTGFAAILRVAPDHRFGLVVLANVESAPLRRIAQTIVGEELGLTTPASPARPESPVAPVEIESFLGSYRNRGTVEIAVRDGRVVFVLDGGAPWLVSRLATTRFVARPGTGAPGAEFVLHPAAGGAPAYLHFGLWAYVK